jgi:D-alanine-D-alanine ligase-like ATP-grasp enzyme
MDKISRLYFKSCKELHLKPVNVPEIKGFQFTLGDHCYFFKKGSTPFNNSSSAVVSCNKYSTNLLFKNQQLPVTNAIALTRTEFKKRVLDLSQLNFPVVIKPTWGSESGKDVICNIKTPERLLELLPKYFKKHRSMCIEAYQANLRSYRVLVFNGEVIGLLERLPSHVIGDGKKTIEQLITEENKKRFILKKNLPFGPLKMNTETQIIFEERGINEEYIPQLNEEIPLLYVCNSGAGGTTVGLPLNTICEENKQIALKAAKVLDLELVGFDFLCEDISKPIAKSRGFIIEANCAPDISIHEKTPVGIQTRVSHIIMKKFIQQNRISYLLQKCRSKYLGIAIKTLLVLGLIVLISKAHTFL